MDGLQLAYKITANSVYGQMGAKTSSIFFKKIAACTTAIGRERIDDASIGVKSWAKEKGYEKIGEFSTKKVTTEMMGSRGRVIIEEWFTTDTSLFRFAIDVESKLASAYGGKAQTFPRSFSESMLRRAGHEFESVEGRVVKYQMSPIDDDGFKTVSYTHLTLPTICSV